MAENSKIEWTDHTFNPWIGCTRVSPACDRCYAEAWAARYESAEWGAGKPRKLTSDANWKKPLKWNHEAMLTGARPRVFCASLSDVFDNEVDRAWRERLWALIRSTPHLDWLLLTKRVGNVPRMLPSDWGSGWANVWLGITVANQGEADRDIPKLLAVPAGVRFLSMEPLLGPVNLRFPTNREAHENAAGMGLEPSFFSFNGIDPDARTGNGIGWVIVGGESGHGARPMHPDWARSLRDQCVAAGVPYLFKQWGEWQPLSTTSGRQELPFGQYVVLPDGAPGFGFLQKGKKAAGRLLDGRTWDELPAPLAV